MKKPIKLKKINEKNIDIAKNERELIYCEKNNFNLEIELDKIINVVLSSCFFTKNKFIILIIIKKKKTFIKIIE
ncbi:hypothetical protein STURON_00851 [Spiroplasma turonicum]|uniref:Uncharacterized protein n=1 Tax=Spiroplasma turonicum TaxID=216946 RepID=A0A0K1P875_9MOLU|nr:hypothetical protein [Spiroplasma turonicum]AKU80097.1 hypothetical protein STURON_00851 [Spiroplasma turonicum]